MSKIPETLKNQPKRKIAGKMETYGCFGNGTELWFKSKAKITEYHTWKLARVWEKIGEMK